jgi:hypothetical protein
VKGYIFDWSSPGNLDQGTICIPAESLTKAQDKFFDWLKKQPIYSHLWKLTFVCTQVEILEA